MITVLCCTLLTNTQENDYSGSVTYIYCEKTLVLKLRLYSQMITRVYRCKVARV